MILTDKEYKTMSNVYDEVKYPCKCGRRAVIRYNQDKVLCTWCHRYVFKDKQAEFKYRLKENIMRGKHENNR